MHSEVILTHANLILETEVIRGTLVFKDGEITDISHGASKAAGAIDCQGDFVAPGLIELHTDNLERHLEPRPAVAWPQKAAVIAHDAELASCGITTVFDAMRVGSLPSSGKAKYDNYARELATELLDLKKQDWLKLSHFIHLRAELCSETLEQELDEFSALDRVGIVSIMDHTPGARQFADLGQLRTYMSKKRGLTDDEFEAHVRNLKSISTKNAARHETASVQAAQRLGAVLASHDDTTRDHVSTSAQHNVTFAEFPTTVAAAQACKDHGIAIMMGAPNLIRGGSHSGNVSACDLAQQDLLDIVSSDYVPAALLQSVVTLGHLWGDWARAMRTVTHAPAQATGLSDRGTLAIGQRADVIQFKTHDSAAIFRRSWVKGRSTF
jgi:alpha-D-ribose 1-methylphosphonate 5-triphosphate diphosphatase